MAYYITVKNGDSYKTIDISNHYLFQRLSKLKNERYSLEELDVFTSDFANILALKEALLFDELIDEKEAFKDLSIRMKKKDEYEKVMYDPVFKDSMKYLDIDYLTYKIKSLSGDENFLNRLINHYRNSYINNVNVAYIRAYILGHPEVDIYKILDNFISREIYNYKYDDNDGTYIITSIKYKALHDLAMFVYNYENKSTLTKEECDDELRSFISYLKNEDRVVVPASSAKPKKRIKRIDEGQTSLFD